MQSTETSSTLPITPNRMGPPLNKCREKSKGIKLVSITMEGQNEGADTKKLVGMFLLGFAIVDFGGSWVGFDLWGTIGIPLPGFLWSYSAIIEGGIAGLLLGWFDGDDDQALNEEE